MLSKSFSRHYRYTSRAGGAGPLTSRLPGRG